MRDSSRPGSGCTTVSAVGNTAHAPDLRRRLQPRRAYKEHLAARPAAAAAAGAAFDFSTSVLTTGFWPAFTKVELRLPAAMAAARDEFQSFYIKKATSRRLDWQYSLGSANVAGTWPAAAAGGAPQTYTLAVVTLQAAALLVFGDLTDGARLTTAGVAEALGCSPDVAKRTLHSLACGKQRVLTKAPEGAKIAPDDTFGVNPKFVSALKKLQIPMASLDEAAASKKIVDDNREHAIDAALVRIMKARKTLAHSVLVMETITQLLFFKPAPRDIKKRIENLIARDYLERAEEGDNVYKASCNDAAPRAAAPRCQRIAHQPARLRPPPPLRSTSPESVPAGASARRQVAGPAEAAAGRPRAELRERENELEENDDTPAGGPLAPAISLARARRRRV